VRRSFTPHRSGAILALLAAPLLLGGCGARGPVQTVVELPPIRAVPPVVEPAPIEMGLPPAPGRYDGSMDVLHYDVELLIPPANDRIQGRAAITYRSRTPGAHPVILDLTGLAVESVTWEGERVPFTHTEGTIRFQSPGSSMAGDTHEVEVHYRGTPDDGLIMRNTVHGEPSAFADNWPNRARFWFPSSDHPSDKATVAFTVHAPAERQVVANGNLLRAGTPTPPEAVGGLEGLRSWTWATRVPIPTYLMVVGVAEMEAMSGGLGACGLAPASPRADGCVEVTHWAYAADTAHARRVFGRSARMLDFYARLVGPYPYEKLANVQSATRFGGMENASVIFYSEQALAQGRNIESTVAHEIAHQWFGNSVTAADWPHLWLSEGFASYFGPLFFEAAEGVGAFRGMIEGNRQVYLASDVTHRPIVDGSSENLMELLNRNSYQKGSLVLHMLRDLLGDEAFFEGIRRYYARYAGGNAVTGDLQAVLEEVHGESLDWFFRQWLHNPGHPKLQLDWVWDARANEVEVVIRQVQDPAWPTFRLPAELEFVLPGGGSWRVERVVDGREWRERIPMQAPPTAVNFDPDGWILEEMVTDR
jgi:aminopeptidase N